MPKNRLQKVCIRYLLRIYADIQFLPRALIPIPINFYLKSPHPRLLQQGKDYMRTYWDWYNYSIGRLHKVDKSIAYLWFNESVEFVHI